MDTTQNTLHVGIDVNDTSPEMRSQLRITEQYHFTPDVETLRAGSSGVLPQDIEFTLNNVPNHYRALATYATWEIRNPRLAVLRARSAECWFKRAIGFRPDDAQLHTLFATFLHRAGRLSEATEQYELAEKMGSESAELFYNRGLLEVDLGNLDLAQKYANRAYTLGYPLPGLRNKLARLQGTTK